MLAASVSAYRCMRRPSFCEKCKWRNSSVALTRGAPLIPDAATALELALGLFLGAERAIDDAAVTVVGSVSIRRDLRASSCVHATRVADAMSESLTTRTTPELTTDAVLAETTDSVSSPSSSSLCSDPSSSTNLADEVFQT